MASVESSEDQKPQVETENPKKSQWLNKDFFADIVQNEYGRESEIEEFLVNSAVGKGENYASILDRVSLNIKTKG